MTKAEAVIRALRGEVTGCVGCNDSTRQMYHVWIHEKRGVQGMVCSVCTFKIKRAKKIITTDDVIRYIQYAIGFASVYFYDAYPFGCCPRAEALNEIRMICGFHDA